MNTSSASYELKPGLVCEEEYVVTEEYSARHISSGTVMVLSTPSMILLIERTALNCVQKYLPLNHTTVGTMVSVKHLNPAPVGGVVRVVVKLIGVEGRRLLFNVGVYYRGIVIGEGQHERYIVEVERFLERVRRIITGQ